MENALGSVPGCKDVTLPYWDISDGQNPLPKWIWEEPFDSFTYPIDVGEKKGGTHTKRDTYENVTKQDKIALTRSLVESAMNSVSWEAFANYEASPDQKECHLSSLMTSPTF